MENRKAVSGTDEERCAASLSMPHSNARIKLLVAIALPIALSLLAANLNWRLGAINFVGDVSLALIFYWYIIRARNVDRIIVTDRLKMTMNYTKAEPR